MMKIKADFPSCSAVNCLYCIYNKCTRDEHNITPSFTSVNNKCIHYVEAIGEDHETK